MNEFCNTRNPVDLWLNVGDFKKSFTYLCYPLVQLLLDVDQNMAIQKRALLHFVDFFASKFDVSGQHSLLPPTSSPFNGKN